MLSYSEISSMTLRELIENHIPLNEDLVSSIFRNPLIRDLPSFASLYGFYSRFIVGQTKVFFAYGIDPDVINGVFHEAEGTVIPDYVVQKCGYFVSWKEELLCPRCEVFEIPAGNLNKTSVLSNRMGILERVIHEYKDLGLPLPEYIDLSTSDFSRLEDLYHVTDNQTLLKNEAKEKRRNQERQLLLDIAIWEWPITLRGKKPGFTAFCGWSRYSIHSTNLEESLRVYNNPRLWQGVFESEKSSNYHTLLREPKKSAEFIMRGLDRMKIPYCLYKEDKEFQKEKAREKKNLDNVLPRIVRDEEECVSFFVSKLDEGSVIYWMCEYTKTLFTPEQLRYGNELYYGTDWWNKEQDPAGYLFFVPGNDFNRFMECADANQIKIGYPDAGWLKSHYTSGVYLISEYSNMPLINDILHRLQYSELSFHRIGMEGNAPMEMRTFHPNKNAAYVRKYEWQDCEANNVLKGSPWYYPLDELLKNGTMVVNKGPQIKQRPVPQPEPAIEKKTSKKLSFMDLLKELEKKPQE